MRPSAAKLLQHELLGLYKQISDTEKMQAQLNHLILGTLF